MYALKRVVDVGYWRDVYSGTQPPLYSGWKGLGWDGMGWRRFNSVTLLGCALTIGVDH